MKISTVTFANIEYLWAIIFVVVILLLSGYMIWWKKKAVMHLAASRWTALLIKHFSLVRLVSKMCMLVIGAALLYIALLRPQWGKKEHQVMQHGRDLFIALDISRSMLAQDMTPDRLSFAKDKIRLLTSFLASERVGLILFSGSAFIQCPLTGDYNAFHLFLDQVDVETISSGTTALDAALKQALEAFKRVPNRQHKLLLILTDGEDFSSNLAGIKEEACTNGVTMFTYGLGTPEGAPIPLLNEKGKSLGHQKDRHGSVVISRLNEGILRTLAHDSGGVYVRATLDDTDVKTIVHTVRKIEKEHIGDKAITYLQDRYHWFALGSFITLALEWLL